MRRAVGAWFRAAVWCGFLALSAVGWVVLARFANG